MRLVGGTPHKGRSGKNAGATPAGLQKNADSPEDCRRNKDRFF
jgi:hypothetical protein